MKGKKENKIDRDRIEISFTINGAKVSKQIRPSLLLIDLLRDEMGLMGTKPGCLEGECGACSVLIDGSAINSCLYLAVNINGKTITTIEGLSDANGLGIVQESMVAHGAVQCGFCSPGMAINIKSLQNKYKKEKRIPTKDEIRKGLEGNLCRCTGYQKIIESAEAVFNNALS